MVEGVMRRNGVLVWVVLLLLSASSMVVVTAVNESSSEMIPVFASAVEMPPVCVGHQMVYDAESDRVVMFGGNIESGVGLVDTWVYDVRNNSWQCMYPSTSPPPHISPGMVYDSKADLIIMFSGQDAGHDHVLQDTWTYDLNENKWTEMTPLTSPPGRIGPHMVYDVRLDKVIMFGGLSEGDVYAFSDTWTYDLDSNTWTEVNATIPPVDRGLAAMAYDTESDRAILFGGIRLGSELPDSETWIYDPNNETWTRMTPAVSPAARFDAASVYDAKADRFLIFGGSKKECNDTWEYDLNANSWSKINSSTTPSSRISAMAYDAESDRTVLFGGMYWDYPSSWGDVYNDTWVFDHGNSTWTMVLPDIVNPTLTITSPSDGDSLTSKEVNVTGTAFDNLGIAKVEISLDNSNWTTAIGSTSWRATISLVEGENTIYVRVTDTSGNTATSTIHVTVPAQRASVWIWIVTAVGVGGVAVAAFAMIRRRKVGH